MVDIHTGGCHCGQLRYQFSGPLHDIAHCHCSICRRVSGGIVTTWITVPAKAFQWLAGTPARYDSSATCARYFCGHCGAQLALVTHLSPKTIDITPSRLLPNGTSGLTAACHGCTWTSICPASRKKPYKLKLSLIKK